MQNKEIGALLQQASDMMQQDSGRVKIWFAMDWEVKLRNLKAFYENHVFFA